MIELRLREFQRGFCKLKEEEILVYGKGGEIIGKWVPSDKINNDVGQASVKEESEFVGQKISNVGQKVSDIEKAKSNMDKFLARFEEEEEEDVEICGKCQHVGIYGYWSGWNEVLGEEIVDMPVCLRCAKMVKVGIKIKE